MRLELAGSQVIPDPLVLSYLANATFVPKTYLDLGYTNFDVICIGGGGGAGGGIDTNNTGTLIRSYGGAGGGGGLHRVKGQLKYLSASCPIVVGTGGFAGANHASNPALVTRGGSGGTSSFNGNTCQASGGQGGGPVITNSLTVDPQGWGGDGGIGNRGAAGGGAQGGKTATPSSTNVPQGPDGIDGTYVNGIGKGGGGGGGGMCKYDGTVYLLASAGGRGSYNLTDTSVFGPGASEGNGLASSIVGGAASGAKATPLNGLPTVYGQSQTGLLPGLPGIVVVRLTAE
jgi:hypothetical protein